MTKKHLFIGLLVLVAALALAACQPVEEAAPTAPPPPPTQACPSIPEPVPCPELPEPLVKEVPYEQMWAGSGHADTTAEAFIHWDEDDPKEVPTSCAKCHSEFGYKDFLGLDGTAAGTVDNAAPIGSVITCTTCHNEATDALTSVVFPSGLEVTGLSDEARCMLCHQGRTYSARVDETIADKASLEDPDTVSAEMGFVNIHYFAAAATLFGTEAQGGYQYAGKVYDARFDHVAGFNTCLGCHNPHTLEVRVEACQACHTNVASVEDLKNVRMFGSLVDYDGDGDTSEGIAFELDGLRSMLYQAIQAYATEKAGTAIVYDPASHPYFFIDTNANGTGEPEEINSDNRFNAWTGRLLRAAYNYQTSIKDPGAFAHGGKYIIELLYDSIEDLNTVIANPIDLSNAHRIDAGHFASSQEPFRHWDEEGLVPGGCAKCHSASGLPTFLDEAARSSDRVTGVNVAANPASGFNCTTCHNDLPAFTRFPVANVKFPSGAIVTFGETADANLCISCHQGRESKASVDAVIARARVEDDVVSDKLSFRNPHYFAAGATLFGTEAKGAYEYDGKTYLGRNLHVEAFSTCIQCHDTHALRVKAEACSGCHAVVKAEEDLEKIRMSTVDFDGDDDVTEGLAGELATIKDALYTALQAYATTTAGAPIVYDGHAYPYFFIDTNANGVADPDEATSTNRYVTWTPRLLRAAYNIQWVSKDPGMYAHNGKYMLQILIDSLADIGGDVSGMIRP